MLALRPLTSLKVVKIKPLCPLQIVSTAYCWSHELVGDHVPEERKPEAAPDTATTLALSGRQATNQTPTFAEETSANHSTSSFALNYTAHRHPLDTRDSKNAALKDHPVLGQHTTQPVWKRQLRWCHSLCIPKIKTGALGHSSELNAENISVNNNNPSTFGKLYHISSTMVAWQSLGLSNSSYLKTLTFGSILLKICLQYGHFASPLASSTYATCLAHRLRFNCLK
ncbi:hypothetical protein BDZ45DRAFT_418630 [Acephala macrosclerotiorum]|nr:hypothetical protein BDZ45DRAFT_418630 [Acephala macrosclerotiorum]